MASSCQPYYLPFTDIFSPSLIPSKSLVKQGCGWAFRLFSINTQYITYLFIQHVASPCQPYYLPFTYIFSSSLIPSRSLVKQGCSWAFRLFLIHSTITIHSTCGLSWANCWCATSLFLLPARRHKYVMTARRPNAPTCSYGDGFSSTELLPQTLSSCLFAGGDQER